MRDKKLEKLKRQASLCYIIFSAMFLQKLNSSKHVNTLSLAGKPVWKLPSYREDGCKSGQSEGLQVRCQGSLFSSPDNIRLIENVLRRPLSHNFRQSLSMRKDKQSADAEGKIGD